MIEHYLPNKNESTTVPKFQLSPQLNTALASAKNFKTPPNELVRGAQLEFISLDGQGHQKYPQTLSKNL